MSESTVSNSQITHAYNEGWYHGMLLGILVGAAAMAIDMAQFGMLSGGSKTTVIRHSDGHITTTTKRGWFW